MNTGFMHNYKYSALIILFLCLTSCYKRTNNVHHDDSPLQKALAYYGHANKLKWTPVIEFTEKNTGPFDGDAIYEGGWFSFRKNSADTIYDLYFEYYSSPTDTIFIPYHLYKRYLDDDFQHVISFEKNQDTLFHYKAELFGSLHKIFISGKYYYQYFFSELNLYQRKYFELHKDSLRTIKGHNLPKLPTE